MISIVMAYFNRRQQILNTLQNFQEFYASQYHFEVIIIDDNSIPEHQLTNDLFSFTFPIKYHIISKEEKGKRINSCIPFNKGFEMASGNIVVIQNPECCHMTDILGHVLEKLEKNDYFSYSCFSGNSHEVSKKILQKRALTPEIIQENLQIKPYLWYNHPKEKPSGYHFCSALHKSVLEKIGGFDTQLQWGYAFEDDLFLHNVQKWAKLFIVPPDKGWVLHQYHETDKNRVKNRQLHRLWKRNETIFKNTVKGSKK